MANFKLNTYDLVEPHLNKHGIDIRADFHTLPSSKVEVLVELARVVGYRQQHNSNGSVGRTFFEKVQRLSGVLK